MKISKNKSKITDKEIDWLIFECECHRVLDLLDAPKNKYILKRLKDYARSLGKDVDNIQPKGIPNGGIYL